MNTKFQNLRWIFLALGLLAVIGLTGMNVYTLYAVHEKTVTNSVEQQKRQLMEFTNQVRSRFRYPVNEMWKIDMADLQHQLENTGLISDELLEIIRYTAEDSLYSEIYMEYSECRVCNRHGAPILVFDSQSGRFQETTRYSRTVSNGLAIAQSRMNSQVDDYRWNTRITFDAHNSMNIVLVNSSNQEVIAYIHYLINQDYLLNNFLIPKLQSTFGKETDTETGTVVWLHDWTQNIVLASNRDDVEYNSRRVNYIQNFPDLLGDWNLKAAFSNYPVIAASRTSLIRNLAVLGVTVLLLLGTFIFMFITVQKERSLVQRQSLFLANVTHELKTPLSVILAAGENIADGRVHDRNRLMSYGSHILKESERLRTLIDRLLDVARFDNDSVKIQKRWINAASFTENVLENKRIFLESLGFNVHFKADGNPSDIRVDMADLTAILENLIDNAVKYSQKEKYLAIRTFVNNRKLHIEVKDRGIGITRKSQKHLFDKFYRDEKSVYSQTRGHGLGLSIVKDLVKRNDGEVYVESSPGKGSFFTVVFPVPDQNEQNQNTNYKLSVTPNTPEHVS